MREANQSSDQAAIMRVIQAESAAFWNRAYAAWAGCWLHEPWVRVMGWWARGGVTVEEG